MSVVQSLALTDSSNQYGRFLIKIDSRNYAFEHLREYIDLSVFEFYCIDKENYRSLFYFISYRYTYIHINTRPQLKNNNLSYL